MGMNFPNSPLPGQVYTPLSGYSYVFLDGVWRVVQDAQSILTADTRNRIVNGAMQISQENAKDTVYTGPGTFYPADQWSIYYSTTGTPSVSVRNTYRPDDPDAEWWVRLTSTVADTSIAATEYYNFRQYIEGSRIADFKWGTAYGKPVVLRFRAYSSIAGTFCVAIRNATTAHAFVKNCTIAANTLTTFVIPIPPPPVGSVWATDSSIGLNFALAIASGSNFNTGVDGQWNVGSTTATPQISNWLSVIGQSLDVSAFGLYLDPLATGVPPRWQMPDEAEELRACQRYFFRAFKPSGGQAFRYASSATSAMDGGIIAFPTVMRVSPAGAVITAPTYENCSSAGFSTFSTSDVSFRVNSTAAGAYRAYQGVYDFTARM